jgi:hypothetical protein
VFKGSDHLLQILLSRLLFMIDESCYTAHKTKIGNSVREWRFDGTFYS